LSSRDDPSHSRRKSWITPKIAFFLGVEDPENHLTAIKAQIIISRGSDVIRRKMLTGTFTGTTLQWLSEISYAHVTSFPQFSRMFKKQLSANKVKHPRLYNLFNIRQREGKALKDYLNRFCAITVRLQTHDEEMMVVAFIQGMTTKPFSDLLIRNPTETLSEVHE